MGNLFWTDVVDSLAACLTTLSFLPQAWHSFRTRDVSGVSLGMYSLFTAGVGLRAAAACLAHRGHAGFGTGHFVHEAHVRLCTEPGSRTFA